MNQKGFTLVELMMAIVTSAIVLVGIFIMVSGSYEYVSKGRKTSTLQQDFTLIDQVLANRIQEGYDGKQKIYPSYADYLASQPDGSAGSCLKLYFPSGDSCLIFKENNSFKIQNSNLSVTNLVHDVVDSLYFLKQSRSIKTAVFLSQDNKTMSANLIHTLRNKVASASSGAPDTTQWPYVLYTSTENIDLKSGSGTITGDIHSNDKVEVDYGKYTINGTITQSPPFVYPPSVNWAFFQDKALEAGQYVTDDKIFDAAGSPYTGVWYTTHKAKIKGNAVINGTIVAEEEVSFEEDNATVTATPVNYPAIVAGKKIFADKLNIQINGFVYTVAHFHNKGDNLIVNGAIVAVEKVHEQDGEFKTITFDTTYVDQVAGIMFH